MFHAKKAGYETVGLVSPAHDLVSLEDAAAGQRYYTAEEIIEVLKKLAKERNKCVIVVTHSKRVADSADVVLELKGRKLR